MSKCLAVALALVLTSSLAAGVQREQLASTTTVGLVLLDWSASDAENLLDRGRFGGHVASDPAGRLDLISLGGGILVLRAETITVGAAHVDAVGASRSGYARDFGEARLAPNTGGGAGGGEAAWLTTTEFGAGGGGATWQGSRSQHGPAPDPTSGRIREATPQTPPKRLHRAFFYDKHALDRSVPGHPSYVWPQQNGGRIDNASLYLTLYCCDPPAGAIAEVLGDRSTWGPDLFEPPAYVPSGRFSLATFEVTDVAGLCNLDDPLRLGELGLRPSLVVTRDRAITQEWARSIWRSGQWKGVVWWSSREPGWVAAGIWDVSCLRLQSVAPITPRSTSFQEARRALRRPWIEP